jgi:hypothetical protein
MLPHICDVALVADTGNTAMLCCLYYCMYCVQIDTIFAGLDLSSSQEVCFTEFVAAALGRQQLDERRLRYAFDRIDYGE